VRSPCVLLVAGILAVACTADGTGVQTSVVPARAASPVLSLPPGLPPSFDDAVGQGDVPAAALVPLRADVTGRWDATTSAGDAIVVAWTMPGPDQFRLDRGIAEWRRFDDGGAPWRPVWGATYPAGRDALQNLTADVADVTGDGSADAIVTAETGGTGGCAAVSVADLAAAERIYRSSGCDRIVSASTDPVGLSIRAAVYRPGDAHCCPSAVKTTILVYSNGTWETVTSVSSPA
jgi:hypothetical protein